MKEDFLRGDHVLVLVEIELRMSNRCFQFVAGCVGWRCVDIRRDADEASELYDDRLVVRVDTQICKSGHRYLRSHLQVTPALFKCRSLGSGFGNQNLRLRDSEDYGIPRN